MKRYFFSLGSLLLVSGLTVTTALAVFLPQARFTGMQLKTRSYEISVARQEASPQYGPTAHLSGAINLRPEMEPFEEQFWVKNTSPDGIGTVNIAMQFEGGVGDWDELKDLVAVRFLDTTDDVMGEWHSLAEMKNEPIEPPSPLLYADQPRKYHIYYGFLDYYPTDPDGDGPLVEGDPIGHEMMNKSITDLSLVISGVPYR